MAISKCVSLSAVNHLWENDLGSDFRIDETGCNSTPGFPVAVYLDDVTTSYVNWHWHDEIEAGFVLEGSVVVGSGTSKATLTSGDVFFVNSGVLHSMQNASSPSHAVFKSITFNGSVIGGEQHSIFWQKYLKPILYAANLRSLILPAGSEYNTAVLSMLSDIWELVARESTHYEVLVRNGLSNLFLILLEIQEHTADEKLQNTYSLRQENRLQHLLEYIHAHYGEHITLDDLASTAAISKTEVMRCFKSVIGKSPMRYLMEYRLQQAANLLLHTERTVQKIGECCGFEDSSYFTKTFRAMYQVTPTEYRRKG
ncbi:MAG: helix-turn-helix transcriptional regulator [Blautia sp.]|nr:helix-turn-helix transcriptional regulator [Blautia sp.]